MRNIIYGLRIYWILHIEQVLKQLTLMESLNPLIPNPKNGFVNLLIRTLVRYTNRNGMINVQPLFKKDVGIQGTNRLSEQGKVEFI